jgi:RNA-binding protein YhbY
MDQKTKTKTLKLAQKIIEKTLEDIGKGSYILNRTVIAQEIRARLDTQDLIKLKSLCTAKETITRMKRQPTE